MKVKNLLPVAVLSLTVSAAAYFLWPRSYVMANGVAQGCVEKWVSPESMASMYSKPPYSCKLYSDGGFRGGDFIFLACAEDSNDIHIFSNPEQCTEFQKLKPPEYIKQVLRTLVAPNNELQPTADAPAE